MNEMKDRVVDVFGKCVLLEVVLCLGSSSCSLGVIGLCELVCEVGLNLNIFYWYFCDIDDFGLIMICDIFIQLCQLLCQFCCEVVICVVFSV